MTVGDVLAIYAEEHGPTVADRPRLRYAIQALVPFWGDLRLTAIKGPTCRRYAATRGVADGTTRRELGTLQAALHHCQREGHLIAAPTVWLPNKPAAKERWLTRRDAAIMLWACRRSHLARFILTGLYTGTRKAAILGLWIDQPSTSGGHIDTETGIIYRAGSGQRRTKKRQGAARLPRQYLAHVRRWKARGARHVVDWNGSRVDSVRTSWATMLADAVALAEKRGLAFDPEGVTPHVLRHSAITWAMAAGANIADVSSFFDVSMETLQRVYWHHSPDHQKSAVRAMERT